MSEQAMELFRASGAIKNGHFLLTSGLHSDIYWEKFRILQRPSITEKLCSLIAEHFRGQEPAVVAGPTTGGMILAFEVARQLDVRSMYAERDGEARVFRRDFEVLPNERVLVVDDILTTGSSLKQTIHAVNGLGCSVIGAGVLVDRSERGLTLDVPLFSCLRSPTKAYQPQDCPLCAACIPLVTPGGASR